MKKEQRTNSLDCKNKGKANNCISDRCAAIEKKQTKKQLFLLYAAML